MNNEAAIRDHLYSRLSIIEDGLFPLEKEYHLPSEQGASGYVDILARDALGMLVIIEIKKSKKSSREAIHEFYKYIALFKTHHGIKDYQYRCILISTEWHELLVPFSSFCRTVNYPVNGYKLSLDESGCPVLATPVDLIPEGLERHLCPSHMIYLYFEKDNRTNDITVLTKYLSEIGIKNYCLVELDYAPSEINMYCYAIYFAFDDFDLLTRTHIKGYFNIELEEGIIEQNPFAFEERVLAHINADSDMNYDSLDTGYPEKFAGLPQEWQFTQIHRGGQLSSSITIPDESLIAELKGTSGDNALLYVAVARPEFTTLWNNTLKKSEYTLQGNSYWQSGIYWFLSRVVNENPKATVSLYIHNPMNIIQSLFLGMKYNSLGYLPSVEIAIDEGDSVVILNGNVRWNGRTRPIDLKNILRKTIGTPKRLMSLWMTQELTEYDHLIMEEMGLFYDLAFTDFKKDSVATEGLLVLEGEDWRITKNTQEYQYSITDFIYQNRDFIDFLVIYIGNVQIIVD